MAIAVIEQIKEESNSKFSVFLLLVVAYGASIGGMSTLVGSPPTPYIFDDHHDINDAVDQIMKLYKMSKEKRKEIGKKGYDWAHSDEARFTSEKMTKRFVDAAEELFSTWQPREKFEFLKDTDYEKRILPHKLTY